MIPLTNTNYSEEISYSYDDYGSFKDQLISYNGTSITYDNLGNPNNWTNGAALTWADTRRLASYTNATNTVTYSYNGDDLRTSKTVNGVVHNYFCNGTPSSARTSASISCSRRPTPSARTTTQEDKRQALVL